jgi:hypothetical protein
LIDFIAVSEGIGKVGVLRGILFKRYAHAVFLFFLSNEGTFRIRELVNPAKNQVAVSKAS